MENVSAAVKNLVQNRTDFDADISLEDVISAERLLSKCQTVLNESGFRLVKKNGIFEPDYIGSKECALRDVDYLESQLFKPENSDVFNFLESASPYFLEDVRWEAEKGVEPGFFDKLKGFYESVKSKIIPSGKKQKTRKWGFFERHVAKKMIAPEKPIVDQRVEAIYWVDKSGIIINQFPEATENDDIEMSMLTAIKDYAGKSKPGSRLSDFARTNDFDGTKTQVKFKEGLDGYLAVAYAPGKLLQDEDLGTKMAEVIAKLEDYGRAPPAFYSMYKGLKELEKTDRRAAAFVKECEKWFSFYKINPAGSPIYKPMFAPADFTDLIIKISGAYYGTPIEMNAGIAHHNFKNPVKVGEKQEFAGVFADCANDICYLPSRKNDEEYEKVQAEYYAKVDSEVRVLKRKIGTVAVVAAALIVPSLAYAFMPHTETAPPVKKPNSEPSIFDISEQQATIGQPFEMQVNAYDVDNDTLEYGLKFNDNSTLLPIDVNTGLLKLPSIPEMWFGKHMLNASVSDGHRHTAYKNFYLNVLRPNAKPFIKGIALEKISPILQYNVTADDNDTGVGGLDILIDDLPIKHINSPSYKGVIDLLQTRLSPGTHYLRARAFDALNENLFSDVTGEPFNVSDKPVIKSAGVQKNGTDNPIINVEAYSESTSNIVSLHADVLSTNVTGDKKLASSGNEITDSVSVDLNGLKIESYTISVSAENENNVTSEPSYTNATPFDDPITAQITAHVDENDTVDWEFSAYDEEGQLTGASVSSTTPTPINSEKIQAPANNITLSGKTMLNKDVAGRYFMKGVASDVKGAEANASATAVVKDHAPVYVYSINPNVPANNATVTISGYDNDTIEDRLVLDVKDANGKLIDSKEKLLSSKDFDATWNFDFTNSEPGTVYFSARLKPLQNQSILNVSLFKNIPFEILNDAPQINSVDAYYDPVNRTVEISGTASDIDNAIAAGNYTIMNKKTRQFTNGSLAGGFDTKNPAFSASAKISKSMPEGDYWVNVTVMDKSGNVTVFSRGLEINNTFKIIPLYNPNEDSLESKVEWDQKERVAYLTLRGNNTRDYEKNDFDKVATPELRTYLRAYLQTLIQNGTINADDPFATADDLCSKVLPKFDTWSGGNEGIWTTDFKTSMDWIKYQIMHDSNLGISQSAKDNWSRCNIFPINYYNDPYFMNLINYDKNNDSILDVNEKIVYADMGIPQNQWTYLNTDYPSFSTKFGDAAAQNQAKCSFLNSKDSEWRFTGNNFGGIDSIFRFNNSLTAKRVIGLIDLYGSNQIYKQTEDMLSETPFSLYLLKERPEFKDRQVTINMPTDTSYELTVSDY